MNHTLQKNQFLLKDLQSSYETTLDSWSRALDLRDKETEGHTQRVTKLTCKIAKAMKLPEEEILYIRRGSLLHDIGKLGVPDDILHKDGPLMGRHRLSAWLERNRYSPLRPHLCRS